MSDNVVDQESAEREFNKIVENYDLILGDEDTEDKQDYKRIKRAIQRGNVWVDDDGYVCMRSELLGKESVRFYPLVGQIAISGDKADGDGKKGVRMLAALTATQTAAWLNDKTLSSPKHGEEFKVGVAIAGLLAK